MSKSVAKNGPAVKSAGTLREAGGVAKNTEVDVEVGVAVLLDL